MADIEKNTDKSQKPKKSKVSVGEKIKSFFRTYKSELKKIVWASPKSVVSNTALVLTVVIVLGAVIGVLDYVFSIGIVGLGNLI